MQRYYYYYYYYYYHPRFLLHSSSAGSLNSTDLTDQALLIHCPAKNYLTVRHVLCVLLVLSASECIQQGGDQEVLVFRIICLGYYTLWTILVGLCGPFSTAIFLLALLSSLNISGASR